MGQAEILVQAMVQVQRDCADILGAVVATPEGLVLAEYGSLHGDLSAAAASNLADHLDQNLGLVLNTTCSEALLWTPAGLWGLVRYPSRHVVLAQAASTCSAGTLRLALGRLRRDLGASLIELAGEGRESGAPT